MHRFLIVIEKVRKNYFCLFSGSPGMHSNRKNTQKKLKNGCMKRYKMHIRGLVKRRTTGSEIPFICVLCCESRREFGLMIFFFLCTIRFILPVPSSFPALVSRRKFGFAARVWLAVFVSHGCFWEEERCTLQKGKASILLRNSSRNNPLFSTRFSPYHWYLKYPIAKHRYLLS